MPKAAKDSRKKRTDGEGSIYQRHGAEYGCPEPVSVEGKKRKERPEHKCSAPWVGALVLGYRDGKPIRKKVTAATKSGAATKLRDVQRQHEAQTLPVGKTPTVEQWMNYWLNNIAARKVGDLTMENSYRQKVRDYIIPLLGHHKLDRLTSDHIEAAWEQLLDTGNPVRDDPKPLAPNTVHQTHRILARALKVALQRRKQTGLRENVADSDHMDAPPQVEEEMTPLTLDECRKVLSSCAGKPNEARWSLALALGLRQGEALGLPWDLVDLDEGVIHVRQALKRVRGKGLVLSGLKSKRSRRDLSIPEPMLPILKAHRKAQHEARMQAGSLWQDNGLVFCGPFGQPVDHRADWQAWIDLLDSAGVPRRRLHDARHSAGTLLLLQGVPTRVVMEILGHSQVSVTMRYQHAVDELKKSAAASMGVLWA